MITVWCENENRSFGAAAFQNLDPEQRMSLSSSLQCELCGAFAWFVKASRNGRAPCFAARHEEGCDNKTERAETLLLPGEEETSSINALFNEFRLVPVQQKGQVNAEVGGIEDGLNNRSSRVRRHVLDGEKSSVPQRNMNSLLNGVVYRFEEVADVTLRLPDGKKGSIRHLVVPLNEAEGNHLHRTRLYWGKIKQVRESHGNYYLNVSHFPSDAFHIEEALFEQVLAHYRFSTMDDLQETYVMYLGVLSLNSTTSAKKVEIEDLSWLGILRGNEE
ncbi:hypothetical protein JSO19_03800 [Leucobacter sp. UCMA 4100]|uniref:hypothetical protein n=1 Tax=Leucobacter sp. UCMA 4100 TaxID=2810534 RepID=UPI0022EAE110|nr:hypothetical protein [Leucobacter sp. UCMA 4100]MDA3146499.1 hypothetical protein [Leucobacter sp. UCMA 4100]